VSQATTSIIEGAVNKTQDLGNCGKDFPGYLAIHEGHLWANSQSVNAKDTVGCKRQCDHGEDCLGFTSRTPSEGKMRCDLYKRLQAEKDDRAKSFSKCSRDLSCSDGQGVPLGFEFSHRGAWKHGMPMPATGLGRCSKDCRHDTSCVGFTHRTTKDGREECLHYVNVEFKMPVARGTHTRTYSKCKFTSAELVPAAAEDQSSGEGQSPPLEGELAAAAQDKSSGEDGEGEGQGPPSEGSESAPFSPTARVSQASPSVAEGAANETDDLGYCGKDFPGYLAIHEGHLWANSQSVKAKSTADCKHHCDGEKDCLGFTSRTPSEGTMRCDLYKRLQKEKDDRAKSFSKCSQELKCSDAQGLLGFKFSHKGAWKHGLLMPTTSLGQCSQDCRDDTSCVGFTHRAAKDGREECLHYVNVDINMLIYVEPGTRTRTYSKCKYTSAELAPASEDQSSGEGQSPPSEDELAAAAQDKSSGEDGEGEGQGPPSEGSESAPFSPTARVRRASPSVTEGAANETSDQGYCGKDFPGYLAIHEGHLWANSQSVSAKNTVDCKRQCDQGGDCLGFASRTPGEGTMRCDLYQRLQVEKDDTAKSFSKCYKDLKCADDKGFRGFEFSHNGSWKHGLLMPHTSLGNCSKTCRHDTSCVGFTHRSFHYANVGTTLHAPAKDRREECFHYVNVDINMLLYVEPGTRTRTYSKCTNTSGELASAS
jgi:predicted CopG family antitoxin